MVLIDINFIVFRSNLKLTLNCDSYIVCLIIEYLTSNLHCTLITSCDEDMFGLFCN